MIDIQPVTFKDMEFLYELLKERTPDMSITHRSMPTFDEHVKFWDTTDYKEAYIIDHFNRPRGMIYLTKNYEVGIFIKQGYKFQGLGTKALELLLEKNGGKRILANINPKNEDSRDFFIKHGFKHIQNTYEYVPQ